MERFQISRTNHDALEFDGDILAKVKSPSCETEDGQRGYALALYQKVEGDYVVSITYLTTCPNEQNIEQAEVVDEPKDVENVLLVFEPCEHVDPNTLSALSDDQRQRLRKNLCRLYDDLITRLLDALTEHCGDWRTTSTPEDENAATQKRGFLGFLGLN